jgi:hypothetical protein
MQQFWTGFAISRASPNSGMPIGQFPALLWPNYNAVSDLTMGLDLNLTILQNNQLEICQLWDRLFFDNGVWPGLASAMQARVAAPAAYNSTTILESSYSGSSYSRAGTIAIAVSISVGLVAATAMLLWHVNKRKTAVFNSTDYQLYN